MKKNKTKQKTKRLSAHMTIMRERERERERDATLMEMELEKYHLGHTAARDAALMEIQLRLVSPLSTTLLVRNPILGEGSKPGWQMLGFSFLNFVDFFF